MGIVSAGIGFAYAQTAADADFNGDGRVGVEDFLLFVARFGTSQGDGEYETKYDLDGDGTIGVSDFLAFVGFFGQTTRNQEPVLKRIGDRGVSLGSTLTIELVASDPDGDTLTYKVSGHPEGSSLQGSTFRWTPTSGSGDTEVTFMVEDGRGGADAETITLRVVPFQFKLISHSVETEVPSFVNIMFQVSNAKDEWVNFLTTEHFEVREDGQAVSPTESAMNIRKREAIPYKLKTVLMLDTSASVRTHLEQIKEAAITLVENMTAQQEIALYEFSEKPVLLQDFTDNVAVLTRAIRRIRLGFPTTNLYGSIIAGSARWEDSYTVDKVQQGFLILLTDGSDTQGSSTLSQALSSRKDKNIYTIGLGDETDPNVLRQLGNAGFFELGDVNELADKFIEIQAEIALFADSFYQLNYMSPKRGDRNHTLELTVKGNLLNSTLQGNFNSRCFFSTRPKIVVNPVPCSLPEGIAELRIAEGDTVRLQAVTYLGTEPPQYSWTSSHSHIVAIEPDSDDAEVAWAIAVGDSGQTATLTVYDQVNGLDRQVKVEVLDRGLLDLVVGPIRRLTGHSDVQGAPFWSPDGRHIAFTSFRDDNPGIYVIDSDGSNLRRLTGHSDASGIPSWSPDGRHIAFLSLRDDNPGIYVIDSIDGSNLRRLISTVSRGPFWSPDGRHIAFTSDPDPRYANNVFHIYIMDSDGSNLRSVTYNSADGFLSWSPDGRHIAFTSDPDSNFDIYVINSADGSNLRRLTYNSVPDIRTWDKFPSWSPDGRYIAFVSYRAGGGSKDIYVMGSDGNLHGSNLRRFTYTSAVSEAPSWSPDGRHIAFTSSNDGNIYMIDLQ